MIKKICIVAPSMQMGGIERSLTTLANYFNSIGLEVFMITIFPFEKFFTLNKGIVLYEPEFKFSRFEHSKFRNILYYFKMLSPFGGEVAKRVNFVNPDIVISYGDWFPHLLMLGLKNKYPFVYSNRSNPNIRYPKSIEFIRWLAYKLTPPGGVIAQTSYAKERKKRIFGNKIPIKIIPNPITFLEITPVEKKNWIVSVGRLHKEKGFIRLIEAFSNIKNSHWKLILVGDGIHKKEIMEFVILKGIEDRVKFIGKVKDVSSILLQSKIFVLASQNEGFPNALLEAIALGLPTVSFDIVAGPSDIIENNKNGILLRDGDIEGLTEAFNRLIDNKVFREYLGGNAKESAKRYNINTIGKEIHIFLNEIKNNWRSSP